MERFCQREAPEEAQIGDHRRQKRLEEHFSPAEVASLTHPQLNEPGNPVLHHQPFSVPLSKRLGFLFAPRCPQERLKGMERHDAASSARLPHTTAPQGTGRTPLGRKYKPLCLVDVAADLHPAPVPFVGHPSRRTLEPLLIRPQFEVLFAEALPWRHFGHLCGHAHPPLLPSSSTPGITKSRIADDLRHLLPRRSLRALHQRLGSCAVVGIGRQHLHRRDQLGLHIHCHRQLVPIESLACALAPMSHLRVGGGYNPIPSHPLFHLDRTVGSLLHILGHDFFQQPEPILQLLLMPLAEPAVFAASGLGLGLADSDGNLADSAGKAIPEHARRDSFTIPDDAYEENDTLGEAYDLSGAEGTWLSSIAGMGIQADDDWYEIDVTSGEERLVVDLRFTHAEGDIDLAVHDANGAEVVDSTSVTDDEYIDTLLPSSGTYYIRVYYDDAGNSYDLWWDDLLPGSSPPAAPDLLPGPMGDTGRYDDDDITRLDNDSPVNALQFNVTGTVAGATVTIYADGTAIGTAVATGPTTTVTTNGSYDLVDGSHSITARQTEAGKSESPDSPPLTVWVDTQAPTATTPSLRPDSDTGPYPDDNVTQGIDPQFDGSASDPVNAGYASGVWKVVVNSDDGKSASDTITPFYNVVLPTLEEGNRTVTATAYDVAGNTTNIVTGTNSLTLS